MRSFGSSSFISLDESINFAENNFILSENVHNLPKEMSRNSTIILMHLNIRSLPQNFDKLKILLLSMKTKPHAISLNETWIKHGHMGEFNCLSDYVLISNSREKSPGGGVAFYIHKSLSFDVNSKYALMHEKNFESLFTDILLHNNQKLTIGTIYRSPNQKSSANAQFINTLSGILTNLIV